MKNNIESKDELEFQLTCKKMKEIDKLVDKIIKEINKIYKKEPKDEVTRNSIVKYIESNYGEKFKIEHVDTYYKEDVEMKLRDCFYWIFVLKPLSLKTERIYITI